MKTELNKNVSVYCENIQNLKVTIAEEIEIGGCLEKLNTVNPRIGTPSSKPPSQMMIKNMIKTKA